MKECSLNNFLDEVGPWLNDQFIHKAEADGKGNFLLHFLDGTKHAYAISDCNEREVTLVLDNLKSKGIAISH